MKDSGVEWLGKVPEHWEMRRVKSLSVVKRGASPRPIGDARYFENDGEYAWVRIADVTASDQYLERTTQRLSPLGQSLSVRLQPGALFLSIAGSIGKPIITKIKCCIHDGFVYFPDFKGNPEFLFRLFSCRAPFARLGKFGTQLNLNTDTVGRIYMAWPPKSEQTAIVRFLEHADWRIQRYIRAKERLIELLEEQKQAVIHQAVTGQIDVRTGQPYPAYKDSGLEWLGKVPVHWNVVRNGQLFVQRNERGFPELPILEVSLKTGVRIRDLENPDRKQMMSLRGEYKRAVKQDIAYNMMRMWQGAVGVAPIDGLVSPAYVVAYPRPSINPSFFSALFRTSAYMTEVNKYSRGIVKDRNRLYWEDFKRMPTPCPPPVEQMRITNVINQRVATVDARLQHIRRQIKLIQEYRTRLIADVVTGQFDVREAAASIAEVETTDESLRSSPEAIPKEPDPTLT